MAYNSDGYIMIDFTEVDFRRTNQTIDGLYKRCVDVIGTNKFILVINANGRTPLPATCSFTNNQYVIDTCIYMFAISSNDNLFIRRNDVPASDIIDDSSISVDKTWSSNKIDTELDGKADTSALADYQPKLTAGTNITIDENNVISSTGGAVIDDTVIVDNKVWSSLNTVEMLAPIDTVVGSPATFKTSLALPLVECAVPFSATQEGSGTPSPTNPRTIVGKSSLDVVVNDSTITKALGGTYYGGSLDVLSGKLLVDFRYFQITTVSTVIDDRHAVVGISDYTAAGYLLSTNPFLCNIFNPSNYSTEYNNHIHFTNLNNFHILTDFVIGSTVSDWVNWLSTHPCYMAYKLYTPTTIQLTPEQITTIIGNNTISTSADTLKVSYKALPIDLL